MRVIAGELKGRHVYLDDKLKTRPIMGKVLKAIFDIIGDRIVDASFLDLFSGTGMISFEALSRGAREVVMVELEKQAIKGIIANCERLDLPQSKGKFERIEIMNRNVFSALGKLVKERRKFDLIFSDPPFIEKIAEKFMEKIDSLAPQLMYPHSLLFLRTYKQGEVDYQPQNLERIDRRVYGRSILFIYQLKENNE